MQNVTSILSICIYYIYYIELLQVSMIFSGEKDHKTDPKYNKQSLKKHSLQQLTELLDKYIMGCGKTYHEQGYMTAKGDSLYNFTCEVSHKCHQCRQIIDNLRYEIQVKQAEKKANQAKNINEAGLENLRNKYFRGHQGCKCNKEQICEQCIEIIRKQIYKLKNGCGASWQVEDVRDQCAPMTYYCDKYQQCTKCSQQLKWIGIVCKEYPTLNGLVNLTIY